MRSSPSELEKAAHPVRVFPHKATDLGRISQFGCHSWPVRRTGGPGRGRGPEPQVTTRLSPSTLIVFSGSGLGAGGFTTDPSVIEYLLP